MSMEYLAKMIESGDIMLRDDEPDLVARIHELEAEVERLKQANRDLKDEILDWEANGRWVV